MHDKNLLKMIAPNPGRYPLMPPLSNKAQVALLARTLFDEGYDDHLAGHISWKQEDGTLLMNPWELTWDEVTEEDIIRTDSEGKVIEGEWNITPAVGLHLEVYKRRPDVKVVVHNHPHWASVFSGLHQVPEILDQTGSLVNGEVAFFDEYDGAVNRGNEAEASAVALGDMKWAILANHGVLVTAKNIEQAYLRASTLETRCRLAWQVQSATTGVYQGKQVDEKVADELGGLVDENGFPFLWEAMVRRALRKDKNILNGS